MKHSHEILGIGNPILDHLIDVSNAYLEKIPGEKYGMETVSYEEMVEMIEHSGSVPKLALGGSSANAIKGLGALGRKCALAGMIGTDPNGEKVIENLQESGVTPLLNTSTTPTAHACCLITPDGRRTLRTYLGAAETFTPDALKAEYFTGVKLVHIEGYTLLYPGVTERAMELAKQQGAIISFDLGSFEVVKSYTSQLYTLIKDFVDITFANQAETLALTGQGPEKGCEEIQNLSEVAIVMMGKKGCFAANGNGLIKAPAYPVNPVDTTGAGDLFASGFLHGYLSKMPLEECTRWGALTARAVVQVVGAEIPKHLWEEVIKSF